MRAKYTYFAAFFSMCALFGCSHDKEEAAAVLRAVEVYRAAPDEDKTAAVEKLRAVACSNAEVCAAKNECMQMAEPTASALKTKIEAKHLLDDAKGDAGASLEDLAALPERLDAASKLLDMGHDHLVPCEDKLTGLRVKYRL